MKTVIGGWGGWRWGGGGGISGEGDSPLDNSCLQLETGSEEPSKAARFRRVSAAQLHAVALGWGLIKQTPSGLLIVTGPGLWNYNLGAEPKSNQGAEICLAVWGYSYTCKIVYINTSHL